MSKHGKIDEFDSEQDDWELFVANNVTQEAKKKAILLTEMGGKAYQVIRNLLVPNTPGEATFNQIVTLMQEHTTPTPSVIVQILIHETSNQTNPLPISWPRLGK